MRIDAIDLHLSRIPLPKGDWGDQIHHVTHIEILVADVTTDTGITGTGFTHTSGVGGRTLLAMLRELVPTLIGAEVDPRVRWDEAWRHIRDSGTGGVTTLALAAIDIALWDALAQHHRVPLSGLLGRFHDRVRLYGSGINLHLSVEEVIDQVQGWKAAGYAGGKVKVGKPDVQEDVERLTLIREAIGSYPLMVDANQGWSFPAAVIAAERFRDLGPVWLEEPFRVDDMVSHARLRDRSSIPLGLGENLYTLEQFREYIVADACDFVQADLGRVGGITPYLGIAQFARAYNLPMTPHFVMELSATVLASVPNALWLEMTDGGTLSDLGVIEPQPIVDGYFVPSDRPGIGLVYDRDKLRAHEVDA